MEIDVDLSVIGVEGSTATIQDMERAFEQLLLKSSTPSSFLTANDNTGSGGDDTGLSSGVGGLGDDTGLNSGIGGISGIGIGLAMASGLGISYKGISLTVAMEFVENIVMNTGLQWQNDVIVKMVNTCDIDGTGSLGIEQFKLLYYILMKTLKVPIHPNLVPPQGTVKRNKKEATSLPPPGYVHLHTKKICVLGQENVGKTTFLNTLKQLIDKGEKKFKKFLQNEHVQTTEGIQISTSSFQWEDNTVDFNFWDFGGLEIYHTIHSLFLTDQAIYIIVWNMNADPVASRVPYWLQKVSFHAPSSPIILIGTHLDIFKRQYKMKQNLISKLTQMKEILVEKFKKLNSNLVDIFFISSTRGSRMKYIFKIIRGLYQPIEISDACYNFRGVLSQLRPRKMQNIHESVPVVEWEGIIKIADHCKIPHSPIKNNDNIYNFIDYDDNKELLDSIKTLEMTGDFIYFPPPQETGDEFKKIMSRKILRK